MQAIEEFNLKAPKSKRNQTFPWFPENVARIILATSLDESITVIVDIKGKYGEIIKVPYV